MEHAALGVDVGGSSIKFAPVDTRSGALLSPLRADLSGLPPLLVQVGEDEHLLSQSLRLRDSAGLDLHLEVYPGQWHVFQINCGLLAVAALALRRVAEFLGERGCR